MGHVKLVGLLLRNSADVNAQGDQYGTALQAASARGNIELVDLLLKNAADVNAQGGVFSTALQAASERSHDKTVGKLVY
jgi:ankyrin repeat protein